MNKGSTRTLSAGILVVFIWTTVIGEPYAFAQALRRHPPSEVDAARAAAKYPLQVPAELGTLKDFYVSPHAEAPFVIHLQDAHANPEAQSRIKDLLHWLNTQSGMHSEGKPFAVAVEGTVGTIHPEYAAFFHDYPEANEAFIRQMQSQGEISGVELYAWELYRQKKGADLRIEGAEAKELYRDNLKKYRDLLSRRGLIHSHLKPLEAEIEIAKSKIFNSALRNFLREKSRGDNQFLSYVTRYLVQFAERHLEINLRDRVEQLRFPNLTRLLYVRDAEKEVNLPAAEQEWRELAKVLKKKKISGDILEGIGRYWQPDTSGRSSLRELLRGLLEALSSEFSFHGYPAFVKWATFTLISKEIDSEQLFEEIGRLEIFIGERLAQTPQEKELLSVLQDYDLFKKLLNLELTRHDYQQLQERLAHLTPESLQRRTRNLMKDGAFSPATIGKILKSRFGIHDETKEHQENLRKYADHALEFYRSAVERDARLLEHALRLSADRPVVLVTGGFHTDGIVRMMKEGGISYAVIAPRITEISKSNLYHEVMLGKHADLSNYFDASSLNKQESLFLKGLIESAAPELSRRHGIDADELPGLTANAVRNHPVLHRRLDAVPFPADDRPFVRLAVKPAEPALPVSAHAVSEVLAFSNRGVYASLAPSKAKSGFAAADISFTRQGAQNIVKKLQASQVEKIGALKVETGPILKPEAREVKLPAPRSEVRASQEALDFHRKRGQELVEYANLTQGKLPYPTHPIERFYRFEDMRLNLMFLPEEERLRYWHKAVDYLRSLKERNGKITIAVMAGGAASRMNQGALPELLIRAIQEDPYQFIDQSKFDENDKHRMKEGYEDSLRKFIRGLDPFNNSEDNNLMDRVLYEPKALLPAGKIDGQWYSLIAYALLNVKKANDELAALGLGRPFVAEIMLNDANYELVLNHLIEQKFYGLKVSTVQDGQGRVSDINHDDLENELMIYTQPLSFRKVAPASVVQAIWESDKKIVDDAARETDPERKTDKLAKATLKSQAAYEYALEYAQKHEGEVIEDRAFVAGGHGDRFHARLGTTNAGRKAPILLDTILKGIEYDFFHNIDNMAMVNDDWMAIFGYMLSNDLSLIFEGSSRPATERGGGGGFDWTPVTRSTGETVLRARQTEDLLTRASLTKDPITGKEISPNYNRQREDSAGTRILRRVLNNQVPVNNASEYDRMPGSIEQLSEGRDVFSANLSPALRDAFKQAIAAALETRQSQLQGQEVQPDYSVLERFANEFRKSYGIVPTPKLISDPYAEKPNGNQVILTIVDESYAWSSQEGLLAEGLVDIVGTPSINDVTERNIKPDDVRFDPLKDRPTYNNEAAQRVRETLLGRVVQGVLFRDAFSRMIQLIRLIEEEKKDEVFKVYIEAAKKRDRTEAAYVKHLVEALIDGEPESSELRKHAILIYHSILRNLIETENRAWEARQDYFRYMQNEQADLMTVLVASTESLLKEQQDNPETNLYKGAKFLQEEVQKINHLEEDLEVNNRAGDVREIYRAYLDNGDNRGAEIIKSLIDSFIKKSPIYSNLHKSASWVAIEIDKLEGRRSEMRQEREGEHALKSVASRSELRGDGNNLDPRSRNIGVVGIEDAGLSTAMILGGAGHQVTIADEPGVLAKVRDGETTDYTALRAVANISYKETEDRLAYYDLVRNNDVIYLDAGLDDSADYETYKRKLTVLAQRLGEGLDHVRRSGDNSRKVFVVRAMVGVNTTENIYSVIRWSGRSVIADNSNFDVVYQPDFVQYHEDGSRTEPHVVFGLREHATEQEVKETKAILEGVYQVESLQKVQIDYMDVRSAEEAKDALLVYLATKLTHFNDLARISNRYGADLSVVAYGAGLDKRIRTLFSNPSLGFGGRLALLLNWIRSERLERAVSVREGQTEEDILKRIHMVIDKMQAGADVNYVLETLPVDLQLLFWIENIFRINRLTQRDFYDAIENKHGELGFGWLRGKKVALLGVGYSHKTEKIIQSPVLKLIRWMVKERGVREFFVVDPNAATTFKAWVEAERKIDSVFEAVQFHGINGDKKMPVLDAVRQSDLTVIASESNPQVYNLDLETLSEALNGKPLFDAVNLFGLRANGKSIYALEDVRDADINLVSVGRPSLGKGFDARTDYYLRDSEVYESLKEFPVNRRVQKDVAVIGGGYVGLVTGTLLANKGHRVTVVELPEKQSRIDGLNAEPTVVPIYEPGLEDLINEAKREDEDKARTLFFTTDRDGAIAQASIVYLAVGTPQQDSGEIDLQYILNAAEQIGDIIKATKKFKTIVIKSTVTPDTFEEIEKALAGKGLRVGLDYGLASNPEFLREGQAIEDVMHPDRTVLGIYSRSPFNLSGREQAQYRDRMNRIKKNLLELWYPLMQDHPHIFVVTDTATSTLIKYAANSFLAVSITLSNVLAQDSALPAQAANFFDVRKPLKKDPRIGEFAFLNPGCGYGGSCFPKDVRALDFLSTRRTGHPLRTIVAADKLNELFKTAIVQKTVEKLTPYPDARHPLEGKTVGMFGITFKPNTDDVREASSARILAELLRKGASQVILHDPIFEIRSAPPKDEIIQNFLYELFKIMREAGQYEGNYQEFKTYFDNTYLATEKVIFVDSPKEAAAGADAVLLVTEWNAYRDFDFKQLYSLPNVVLIDGRNLYYDRVQEIRNLGIDYSGVGVGISQFRSELRKAEEAEFKESFSRITGNAKTTEAFRSEVFSLQLPAYEPLSDIEQRLMRLFSHLFIPAHIQSMTALVMAGHLAFLKSVLIPEAHAGVQTPPVLQVAKEALGEYAWMLDTYQTSIHLIQPINRHGQPEDYPALFALLASLNQSDKVSLLAEAPDTAAAAGLHEAFVQYAQRLGISNLAFQKLNIVGQGSQTDAVQWIKRAVDSERVNLTGILTSEGAFGLANADLLTQLGYVRHLLRMKYGSHIDENTATLLGASFLKEQPDTSYQYEVQDLERWIRRRGIDLENLAQHVSQMIQAVRHLATQA